MGFFCVVSTALRSSNPTPIHEQAACETGCLRKSNEAAPDCRIYRGWGVNSNRVVPVILESENAVFRESCERTGDRFETAMVAEVIGIEGDRASVRTFEALFRLKCTA